MDLKQRLINDFKDAMKNKDVIAKQTVTMVRAAILFYEKNNKTELDDAGIIDVIASELKKRRESLIEFQKANRDDLVSQTEEEIKVLMKYLPAQLSDEEIESHVIDAIKTANAQSVKDMGKVMAILMPALKGKADGGKINQLVKKHLS
ncbi:MAG: GatB/YqeY domain-containing protein [Eubacteriaceae bacterium]|nr:GatB/YqeY domain-containing protein [Eubacteriaceae bacterium]